MATRRLRILFYISAMDAGGAQRQIIELLRRLDRSRFEPLLALDARSGPLLAEVPADVPIHARLDAPRVTGFGLGQWARWRFLARLLHAERIDLIYDRTYLATLDAAGACWFRPTPRISAAVADPQVQFNLYARRPRWLWRWFSRWAYRTANVVLANSAGLRQQLIDFWQLPPSQVVELPNGFDFDRLRARAGTEEPLQQDGRWRLLTVGRIDADKGHAVLLDAVEDLVKRRGRTTLLWQIVGVGPAQAALEAAVRDRGLSGHVEFLGQIENPFPYYRQARLCCLPSRTEGLPNVLIEALALGTPVLATDCPSGPREILADGAYGRLVPVGDSAALSAAIEDCLHDETTWRAQAHAGQCSVEQRYAIDRVLEQLETLIERLVPASCDAPTSMST